MVDFCSNFHLDRNKFRFSIGIRIYATICWIDAIKSSHGDSRWYYFLCNPWKFWGFIIINDLLFSQYDCDTKWNGVTPYDHVAMSMQTIYYLRAVLITQTAGNISPQIYWFISYLTIKQTFRNISWTTLRMFVCVSNFSSVQKWSAICINRSKTNTFF